MAIDPIAEISRGLEVVRATAAQTKAELDKATADYNRAVDDPPWATVHGTTIAELKAKVQGLTWRLGRDQAVVEQLLALLPPIQDGPAPAVESSPAPPLPPKSAPHPRSYSPPEKPGDPPVTHGQIQDGPPTGPDFRFAQDDVLRRLRDGMGMKKAARDGTSAIRVIAGDEPDDSPDIYDTFDASFKMEIALRDTFKSGELKKDVAEGLQALLTPDAIASFVAFTGVAIAAALAGGPIGWFIGATGLVILYAALGQSFFDFWSVLFNDVRKARNKRQYDLAVKKLARVMSDLGVNWITTMLTIIGGHFVGKVIEKGATQTGETTGRPPTDGPAPIDASAGAVDAPALPKTRTLPPNEVPPPESPAKAATKGLPPEESFNPIDDGPAQPREKTDPGGSDPSLIDDAQQRAAQRQGQPFLNDTERAAYQAAMDNFNSNLNDTMYGRRLVPDPDGLIIEGVSDLVPEDAETAARRYAYEHSIPTNESGVANDINIRAARHDLEGIVTGTNKTLQTNPRNFTEIYRRFREAYETVRKAEAKYPDYWDRMDAGTRESLQREMELAETQTKDYWEKRLEEYREISEQRAATNPIKQRIGRDDWPALTDGPAVDDAARAAEGAAAEGAAADGPAVDSKAETKDLPAPAPAVNLGETNALPGPAQQPAIQLGETKPLPLQVNELGSSDAAAIRGGAGKTAPRSSVALVRGAVLGLAAVVSFSGGLVLAGIGRGTSGVASVGTPAASQSSITETSVPASLGPTVAPIPSTKVVVIIGGMGVSDSPVTDDCIDSLGNHYMYYHYIYTFRFLLANFGVGGTPSPSSVQRLVGRTVHVTIAGGSDAGSYTTTVAITNIGIQAQFEGHPCPTNTIPKLSGFSVDGLDLVPAGDGFQADLP